MSDQDDNNLGGSKTPIYGFNLPTPGADEDTWGLQLNQNWSSLDNLLAAKAPVKDADLQGAPTTTEPTDVTTPSNRIANMASVIKAIFANMFWDKILNKPATFPPPIASATQLGGIKVGQNLVISADGVLDATDGVPYGTRGQIAIWEKDGTIIDGSPWANLWDGELDLGGGPIASRVGGKLTLRTVQQIPWSLVPSGGWTMTLPPDDGQPNQVMATDGKGVMSWTSVLTEVPMATTTRVGGIKVGGSFDITGSGSLVLQPALASQIGGVKVVGGNVSGIAVGRDGLISVIPADEDTFGGLILGKYLKKRNAAGTVDVDLPIGSAVAPGIVGAGRGLSIDAQGFMSVSGAASTSVSNRYVLYEATNLWTPAPDCTLLKVHLWGGGASGCDASDQCGGSGGGAGGYVSAVLYCRPGYKFKVNLGSGGKRDNATGNGGNGGESDFIIVLPDGTEKRILQAFGGKAPFKPSSTDDLPSSGGLGGFVWLLTGPEYMQRWSDVAARGGEGAPGFSYQSTKWPYNNGRFRMAGRGGTVAFFGGGNTFAEADAYGAGGAGGSDRSGATGGKDGRPGLCIIEYDGTAVV